MSKYHQYYDRLNVGKKNYAAEVSKMLKLYQGLFDQPLDQILNQPLDKILEVGSGTGSHTEHLCNISKRIVACDIDPDMIKIASKKLQGKNVEFKSDISNVEETDFPLCVMMWHVLNYFPNLQTINHIFSNINRCLKPGAPFVFDAWNGVAVLRDLPRTSKNEVEVDGLKIVHELNGSTSLMEQKTLILNKIQVYKDGKIIDDFSQEVTHHIWTPKTIVDSLHQNGFEKVKIVKTNDYKTLANEDDWKVLFVAQKIKS